MVDLIYTKLETHNRRDYREYNKDNEDGEEMENRSTANDHAARARSLLNHFDPLPAEEMAQLGREMFSVIRHASCRHGDHSHTSCWGFSPLATGYNKIAEGQDEMFARQPSG
ncbi:hypothetical protein FRB98_003890 [Tulasnella sp. 332]|nr:hypothetical protein FRB98_003890 [Tulasnella sp. 332]